MQKILIIQTAFIGDVVLATGIVEKLHETYPKAKIDFLLRSGNEGLFLNHPFINNIIVWQKSKHKYLNLLKILFQIREEKYDTVVNVQRFAATGFLTGFSKAKLKIGFDKNPFNFLFNVKVKHLINSIDKTLHEIDRNQHLINLIASGEALKPKLYPSKEDDDKVIDYKKQNYITIAPASVWFTKQFPSHQWISFINDIPSNFHIYLLGTKSDSQLCDNIISHAANTSIENLSGKLNFLQSASLMKDATMNYVNDSAPMHFASSVNAPVAAIYCSTIPAFGFGPLSTKSFIVETQEKLNCRPCGLHGKRNCPEGHFNCANKIKTHQLIQLLN